MKSEKSGELIEFLTRATHLALTNLFQQMPHLLIGPWCLPNNDRIPSTTPGAEPPRDAKDSGSARSHSTQLETSSSNRP